ncbi:aromatase/cyclase [Streptomyces gardneri]|uniref:aromatase/cyclase n=1 Tax=Streptomyces gardneri TaxID=66892 RepID=UPI0006BD9060|nr:aromatase/cyclase [Streptomyces gardneri]WRK36559.1 aromatase/cyclase [Streptomyces venezuelae]CUM41707.1 Aromatase WhiE VI [Streptomyces venezuelae]
MTITDTPTLTDAPTVHVTRHETVVAAPPEEVYALVADVTRWPQVFGPTVYAEVTQDDGTEQALRIWAFANGEVRSWASRRTLDRTARTIVFRQVVSSAPVAAMGGEWRVEADQSGGCRVVLLHDYAVVDDDPQAAEWVARAVETNSVKELDALRATAEQAAAAGDEGDELTFTFCDSERIQGSARDVYAFLDRADLWPERLPHVAATRFTEEDGGVQVLDMDTRSPDGSLHNTRSVRVSFPERGLLVYKQLKVPPVMAGHTGRWTVVQHGDEVTATSWHTVTLDPAGVRQALGEAATITEARGLVRHALGTNSSTTLRHAKAYAEAARA